MVNSSELHVDNAGEASGTYITHVEITGYKVILHTAMDKD